MTGFTCSTKVIVHTVLAASDSHGDVGEARRTTYVSVLWGRCSDASDGEKLRMRSKFDMPPRCRMVHSDVFCLCSQRARDSVCGFIGAEIPSSTEKTVHYHAWLPHLAGVGGTHSVYVNGRLTQRIFGRSSQPGDAPRPAPGGPLRGTAGSGRFHQDGWIVLDAVGDRPMFPVVTGTEEPFCWCV